MGVFKLLQLCVLNVLLNCFFPIFLGKKMWQQLGSGKLNAFVISEEIGKTFSHCCVEFCHLKNESMIYFRKTISTRSNFWHLYGSIPMSGLTDFYNGGAFNNYGNRSLPFFDPLPLPTWTVVIPWVWTKTDIFLPPPPSSCLHSYWMTPK